VLKVWSHNFKHNHQVSPSIFKHLPKQRRINDNEKDLILDVIECEGKKKVLSQKIEERTGKIFLRKDINNFIAKERSEKGNTLNDAQKLILEMKKVKNAFVDVSHFENEIKSIFFQDERMKKMFELYPEVVLVDATYKTNNMRMPLFVMLVVDGNGETGIAGLAVIQSESIISTSSVFEALKKHNYSYKK